MDKNNNVSVLSHTTAINEVDANTVHMYCTEKWDRIGLIGKTVHYPI